MVSGQVPNKSRHLYELTGDPSIRQYGTGHWLSCFDSCQLTILWMANVKDVDLPRHAWDTSPPFDSLPYPTRAICRRVRTYARSVTWQPKEKRLTIFYEYGALSHARFAREGAPLWNLATIPLNNERLSHVNSKFPTKKIANCSPYFTASQDINNLETQRSF